MIQQHPADVVAKNGCASVLMTMGRFTDVLNAAPTMRRPATRDEWIAQHIRAMALLRLQRDDEALALLDAGAKECAFFDVRAYFSHALAIVALRGRQYLRAAELVDATAATPASMRTVTEVIRLHAHGAQGDRAQASRVASSIVVPPAMADLMAELRSRYVDGAAPAHTDQWVFEREVTLMFAN